MEDEKLIEAIEKIRRDKNEPLRYIWFTFLNGIARGLGLALGVTLFFGVAVYILTKVLSSFINFPVLGSYVSDLLNILDVYIKQGVKIR